MHALRPRLRALAVGAGAVALVVVGVGGTVAASNPATLYACYDVYGNVKMSDVAQCKLAGGGRLVSWSTVGVPGPTGPQGPTGPTGATGATGPTGPTAAMSTIITRADWAFAPEDPRLWPGAHVFAGAECPSGTTVVSGWSAVTGSGADYAFIALVGSGPTVSSPAPPTHWEVAYYLAGPPPGAVTFQVYSACAP